MLNRREFLLSTLATPLVISSTQSQAQTATQGKMLLAMHQNTSSAAGFRGSLEGWARAGIEYVELNAGLLDGFLESDTLSGARTLLDDLGQTPICAAVTLPDLWIPGPQREASLESWRMRCDQFATLGLDKIYSPSITFREVTTEDFDATPAAIREVAEIASEYNLNCMIEFLRNSRHLATLSSALRMTRAADHSNIRPMIDFFHFWAGLSKLEDLDLLDQGELLHCHFQDLLDAPRELTDNSYRVIPGDGIAPLNAIITKLAEKGYNGALSVELFRQELVNGDPFEVATEIKRKSEAVMNNAQVL
ncbi:MAG: sugar phosphate isomerase/epimerase [Pseudomonadales bacterium]|nr:sugar phosphate isomerase/epimerase [Pseudomonadales bacterium]